MNSQFNTRLFATIALTLVPAATICGGTLSGKVSGGKGPAVVYIEAVAGKTFPAPSQKSLVDQKGLQFVPHVMAVPMKTTVEFQNSDDVAHNIFWPAISGNKKLGHNLGTWPEGQKREFMFDHAGVVPLLCNVHPEMSGYLIVTPTPYFSVTGADGGYKIADLPDGQYTVSVWREGTKIQSKPVKVEGNTSADVALSN